MNLSRKAESSRREGKRKPNPIIVVVCEGKDTEVNYFEHFDSRYARVDVKVADKKSKGKNKGKTTDCENLVKRAIYFKENKYDINEKDGDRVWCIFDADINYNNNNSVQSKIDEIERAKGIANNNKIRLGISNPCFELWYLLHFKYTTAYLKDYDAVKLKIEGETPIKEYGKSEDIYNLLKHKMNDAVKNGEKLRTYHEKDGKKLTNVETDAMNLNAKDVVKSNPYTNIMDLIKYIEILNHNNE